MVEGFSQTDSNRTFVEFESMQTSIYQDPVRIKIRVRKTVETLCITCGGIANFVG
jgi:hypothetical protein